MSKLSSNNTSSGVVRLPGPSIADTGVAVGKDAPPPPAETFFTGVGTGVGKAVGTGVEVAVGEGSGEGSLTTSAPDEVSEVGVEVGTGVAVAGTNSTPALVIVHTPLSGVGVATSSVTSFTPS